jgi:hypothetical protein
MANLGVPGKPLATKDPISTDILPVDDAAWDDGVSIWKISNWNDN